MKKRILLIGFYNEKALGVRYLANAFKKKGYEPHILFLKKFNSIKPEILTEKELKLLVDLINKIKPSYIGLSVMSSLYLESVYLVNDTIKSNSPISIIWGGVYASLFPNKSLDYCDYVIRGEGEDALPELIDYLEENKDISDVKNLVFKNKANEIVINDMRPVIQDLDSLGTPEIGGDNKYLIH